MNRRTAARALGIATVWVAVMAAAQDDPDRHRVYLMEETVVTASPIVQGTVVDRYAETSSIVSERQIEELNALDLPASLRRIPGVSISRYNLVGNYGGGDGGAVFVRGHGSGRPGGELSTSIDGIPRFNGFWSHPLMDLTSLDITGRIEVQKSPRPVTGGNMSFGSVDMQPRRVLREGYVTRVSSSGGSYGTVVGQVSQGGRKGRFDYLVGAGNRYSDGHRDNADGRTQCYYGRAGYRLDEHWDLSVLVDKTKGWAHDPLPVGAAPTPVTNRYDTDNEFYLAKATWKGSRSQGWLKAYYDNGYADWRQWDAQANPPEQGDGISDYDNYGLRGRITWEGWRGTELLLGADIDSYGGSFVSNRTSGPGDKLHVRLSNVAPYAMVSRTFGHDGVHWTPSAGVRVNASSDFGTQVAAQAGLVAQRGDVRLHAGWARAFNLPGPYAAIFYRQYWHFAYQGDEWKDLDAEWMNHVEIGGAYVVGDRLSVNVTAFRDKVTDALRIVSPPPPPPSIQNVGRYITRGVEVSVDAAPVSQVRVFAGATVSSTTPGSVPDMPDFTVSTGAAYTWHGKLRLHADAEYVDDQYVQGTRKPQPTARVDGYFLANLRAGYLYALGAGVAELFVDVENVLDQEYEYRVGYPMPGRTGFLGLNFQL